MFFTGKTQLISKNKVCKKLRYFLIKIFSKILGVALRYLGNRPNLRRHLILLSKNVRPRHAGETESSKPPRIMLLSSKHAIGYGVPVVLSLQAEMLLQHGYEVIVAGPSSQNDYIYEGCKRAIIYDSPSAVSLGDFLSVDLIIAHTPPFFGVATLSNGHTTVFSYDHGEPPPDFFPDVEHRKRILAKKDQDLLMSTKVFAISDAIALESRTPVHRVIPNGNSHLGRWTDSCHERRNRARKMHGLLDENIIILNVCRFHGKTRQYKGINMYIDVKNSLEQSNPSFFKKAIFVICGKGNNNDVKEMTRNGLRAIANVSDEEMIDLYCAADIYANFSKWEGYNLGIGQALAMGLPVVASDIAAHRAFGIKVTNDPMKAAELVVEAATNVGPRKPRLWEWDDSLSQLLDEVNLIYPSGLQ